MLFAKKQPVMEVHLLCLWWNVKLWHVITPNSCPALLNVRTTAYHEPHASRPSLLLLWSYVMQEPVRRPPSRALRWHALDLPQATWEAATKVFSTGLVLFAMLILALVPSTSTSYSVTPPCCTDHPTHQSLYVGSIRTLWRASSWYDNHRYAHHYRSQ